MRYRGTAKSLPEIARELNVDAFVDGSIQRVEQHVRISARLIQASSDAHLWYTVRFEDASGRGVNSKQLYLLDLRNQRSAGIAPGAQRSTNTALQVMAGVGPIVRALLDAVLFQDGEMVGPDKTQTFESVVARISAERDLSNKVLAARNGSTAEREAIWSFISDVAQARAVASAIQAQGDVDIYRKTHKATAAELLRVRDSSGVVAAYDLAGKSIVYPNIWRQK